MIRISIVAWLLLLCFFSSLIHAQLLMGSVVGSHHLTGGGGGGGGGAAGSGAARIQCEYRDIDGDSLILNCTLVTGLSPPGLDSSVIGGVLVNSLEQFGGGGGVGQQNGGGGGSSSSSSSSTAHLNIRVGMDRHWRTPWESLMINHNIIRTLIWRNSRLADIGPHTFKDLNSIQRLDLSYNRLVDLNSSALGQLEVHSSLIYQIL